MNALAPIINIAAICQQLGLSDAVLSPGSRNAPLLVSFARHPAITTHIMIDERAAGFVAFGIAQQQQRPVVLACTSGTAPLNYAPAIAEAYYQQVPLLVLTVDRPPEWIDQQDGQTIVQPQMYQQRVKACYQLPTDHSHPDAVWHIERSIAEAVHLAMTPPYGPVHVNIPLREPFYPDGEINFAPRKVIQQLQSRAVLEDSQWHVLLAQLQRSTKVLIVLGQQGLNSAQIESLKGLNYVVVGDIVSNQHPLPQLIQHADMFLGGADAALKQALQPDLLITCGLSVVSKNLKLYLRTYPAAQHWHVQLAGSVADTYQSLTQIIRLAPEDFWQQLAQRLPPQAPPAYQALWQHLECKSRACIAQLFTNTAQDFNEFRAVYQVLSRLPLGCQLHLGNSMTVRYANFIALLPSQSQVQVFANRGTSGIEGSLSTALGHARVSTAFNLVILGDLSFFYDRNALWSGEPLPANLRIVLLNNQGGGIFNLLPNSSRLPECERFFMTPHTLNAANSAQDFGLDYSLCQQSHELSTALADFFSPGGAKLLEIHTEMPRNSAFFHHFKQLWSTLCQQTAHGKP